MHRLALTLLLLAATDLPASAQQVALSMRDGLVTMDARNATVRQILSEWAKVGRVAVVNGETVTGPPVTLQLASLPEQQALDIILRGVAGYMVVARAGGAPLEASLARFDRVLILPASAVPPAPAAGTRTAQAPRPGAPAPVAVPPPYPVDDFEPGDAGDDNPQPARPVFQPGPGPRLLRAPVNSGGNFPPMELPKGGVPPVVGYQQPGAPAGQGGAATPANPFGIPPGSGGAPGVVVPVAPGPNPGAGPATR
ncbi:MAG: hypothetical protein ABL971_12885 [Vicinamibacterales bacterium]